ncbi:MAG: DUF433 domain-containing protein [Candidatus Promineifilaceae bacterium]
MDTITLQPHLTVLQSWQDGSIRVGNSRVLLDLVIVGFNEGRTPEEIVIQFPALKLAEVYSAIAYYLENRNQIDAYLADRAVEAEALWAKIESEPHQQALRQKLLARKPNS